MPFEYIDIETAQSTPGLKMVVVKGVPSPWSESAKGILHVKGIPWKAIYHLPNDPVLAEWTGHNNAPVLMDEGSRPRTGWAEILLFAEAEAPNVPLLPEDAKNRAELLGLAHEMLGQEGLAWSRRLQVVHLGMQMDGPAKLRASYIGEKYGYDPQRLEAVSRRIQTLLSLFSERLRSQKEQGSNYYHGDRLSVLDIYSAATMALFAPLPDTQCALHPATRAGFSYLDAQTKEALDPLLLEHRDMIYEQHLELPLKI